MVFFGVLEIMAREFDVNMPGELEISLSFLRRKLHLSQNKIKKILIFCDEHDRINADFKEDNDNPKIISVYLKCSKLRDLCDAHTQKILSGNNADYGKKSWKKTQQFIRKRDGFLCKICGKSTKENNRSLPIHHIIPLKTFENFKEANIQENLITLCNECHIRAERGKLNIEIHSSMDKIWKGMDIKSIYKSNPKSTLIIDKEEEGKGEVEEEREKEEEIKKKEKRKKPIVRVYTPENFIEFYDNYPKHAEKKDALLQWELLNKRKETVPSPAELIKIVNLQIENNVLDTRESCKYCMSPRRWLHGDRWGDEIRVIDNTSGIGGMDALQRYAKRHNVDMEEGDD